MKRYNGYVSAPLLRGATIRTALIAERVPS